jgi:hypothetical protein
MKKANEPITGDFQAALEALFPKYIESDGLFGDPSEAFMLNGYKLMGGGYVVSYSSFLAKKCNTIFSETDEDAIDCMKYLAHKVYNMVSIRECTKERYEQLCRGEETDLRETKRNI